MSSRFIFTPLKRGIVSVRTGEKPEPHITLLWRHALEPKPDFPDKSGVYVLADLIPGKDGKQSLYVGRSAETLINQRIHQHCITPLANISEWLIAVCFTGDDRNSTLGQVESRALEYLLYENLTARPGISLANQQTPIEPSLPNTKWENLKAHQQTVVSLLGALGVLLDKTTQIPKRPSDPPPEQKSKSPKRREETVSDLLVAGLLQVGEVLESSRKNRAQQAEAKINDIQGNIMLLRYAKDDEGRWLNDVSKQRLVYDSPSGAGGKVIRDAGGKSDPNGWTFWVVASSGKTLADIGDDYQRLNLRSGR